MVIPRGMEAASSNEMFEGIYTRDDTRNPFDAQENWIPLLGGSHPPMHIPGTMHIQ